jgi:hypothetical protein
MGCEVAGGGGGPAFDCNAALGNFARRKSLSICVSYTIRTYHIYHVYHIYHIYMSYISYTYIYIYIIYMWFENQ